MAFTIPRVSVGTAGRLGKISRLGWLVIAGSVVLLLGYNSCPTYVRPGEAGVKQSKFGQGIEVVDVYVRRYIYDSRYQQAIEQRKIQDQTVYKNEAEAKAATAAALKNKIVAEGAAAVQVELSRGDAEMKKLEAQADLYRRQRAADGDLLVKLAEAQGTELENRALRGVGSENMVGLRMADALKNTKVIVLPTDGESGMNPLDLRALLKRFDVGAKP